MRLAPGTALGPYVIDGEVGEGGMGVVYRAHDRALDRVVAVKCLHANLCGDPEVRRRFAREARVLRAWRHANVVAVHDFLEHEHLLAIVMELIDGVSLHEHIVSWRGAVPLPEVSAIFAEILEAMDDGHQNGVVHRDLKPANILLAAGLQPKLVDFGIAKILEGTTFTVSGALLGTCRYMSPEQIQRPHLVDPRSDIYSLGVTLFETVTGQVPFGGDAHFAIMMAHVQEAPPPPSRHRPDLPEALECLILDALAKDPAARPQTCAIFRERLIEAVAPQPRSRRGDAPPRLQEKDGGEMILVPEGPFKMGAQKREIHLDAFYLDRRPVTNRQFQRFLEVTGYAPTDEGSKRLLSHWRKGQIPPGLEEHPVVYVSWRDAVAYATWAGKRLPTEAEWEKAARGVDGRKYPWGAMEPTVAVANFGKRTKGTTAVSAHPEGASPYGIEDLAGNVWEWCEDVDDPTFYASGPARNPRLVSPPDGPRVMRGGAWMYSAGSLRTTARTAFEMNARFASGGFRCAR
jgi:serine/threonine-protein kinase